MTTCLDCGEREAGMHGVCPQCHSERVLRVWRSLKEDDDDEADGEPSGQVTLEDF